MESITEKEALSQAFRRDGFMFLPGFLSPEEVDEVNVQLEKLIRDVVPTMPPEHAFYEGERNPGTLKQLQTLFDYDSFFSRMMFGSRFEKLASVLLDDAVTGQNMQYFNKPPKIGKPTPAHQDGFYFMLEPNEAVTMWMALEPVDEENGCVRYVRGSQLRGLRPHGRTGVLGFSQGITDFGTPDDLQNEVYFPTRPGDLLVHHSLTIHRADGNQSENRTRKALGFIYYAERAKEDVARKQAYQQQLAQEIRAQADTNA
jgi:phytanoyl-CoA hydroxylase